MFNISYGTFLCKHIFDVPNYRDLIKKFSISRDEGQGLRQYLTSWAEKDEINNESRTYLVLDKNNGELVAYFSLKTGMISINERISLFRREFDTIPGIELANFAVNDSYKGLHNEYEGIGKIIFIYFVNPIVKKIAEMVGVNILYIYALPYNTLIEHYKTYGFVRLPKKEEKLLHKRTKPRYDENCIFMYQKI